MRDGDIPSGFEGNYTFMMFSSGDRELGGTIIFDPDEFTQEDVHRRLEAEFSAALIINIIIRGVSEDAAATLQNFADTNDEIVTRHILLQGLTAHLN